jgi:hypothetical protein
MRPNPRQDRFVISMCNDPIVVPAQLQHRYQEMADANFTLVSSTAWLTPGYARAWGEAARMGHVRTRAANSRGPGSRGDPLSGSNT